MSEPASYSLQVLRVQDVVWKPKFLSKAPNLYVTVGFGDDARQTRIIKRDTSPAWNDTLSFSLPSDSAVFNIRLKHKSLFRLFWKPNPCVGSVEISLSDLLKSANVEVQRELFAPHGRPELSTVTGTIHLCLKTSDLTTKADTDLTTKVDTDLTTEADIDLRTMVDVDLKSAVQEVQQRGIVHSAAAGILSQIDGLATELGAGSALYQSLAGLCANLSVFTNIIDQMSTVHPYLNAAWQVTSSMFKVVSKQFENDKAVAGLVSTMEETFKYVCAIDDLPNKVPTLQRAIIKLLNQTTECCLFVRDYISHGFAGRIFNLNSSSSKILDFEDSFGKLREELNSGTVLHVAFVSARISVKVDAIVLHQQLDPSKMNASNRPRCLPGTRGEYLNRTVDWLFSDINQNILWLHGVAGSGKSTIAATVADYCDNMTRLAAFLFFERGKEEHNSIIRTIAFELASFDSAIAPYITAAVEQNTNINDAPPARQFEKLLLEPLNAAADTVQGPVIIILDALDECGTSETRRSLMLLLKTEFPKLPSKFRFVITSRPEDDINRAFSTHPHVLKFELDHTSGNSRHDVRVYIDREMREAVKEHAPEGWPWDDKLNILDNAANGLFIWASTALKTISGCDDPLEKLNDLISNIRSVNGYGLDELYATVLKESGISWTEAKSKDRFSKVLGLILFGKVPLSDDVIDNLLGLEAGKSRLTLQKLHSVLSYEPGKPIHLHHASFADYLLSSKRSDDDPWFINVDGEKQMIATRCFDVMAKSLRFNICDLEMSFNHNDKVEGLDNRIKEEISPHLEYACRFWAEHLRDAPSSPCLVDKLSTFAKCHLLYWFEVLSLTKHFRRFAGRALLDAVLWSASKHSEISSFLWDAYRLASIFAPPISQSTPHIYLSALILSKGESVVSDHYSKTHPVVSVHRLGTKASTPCIKTFQGHTSSVLSVAFSPDGKRVVSGSSDHSIRVWDAESGEVVSGPLEGHTSFVLSVAFSPDGKRFVSGSYDHSIRVWDAESGEVVSGPLEGHTSFVLSVAFSPDGKRFVSGSYDHSIRVWDAESGEVVSGPFKGHTSSVLSVAFSPDGKRVVSGSEDHSIRVWDAESGEVVSGPFEGHTSSVWSVAFSPDGKRVVSGSEDHSIRVWDVESGEVVSGPFEGHTSSVWSVAFSPDGKRVVSGSEDHSIRVWDAESGEVVSGPFEGHTSSVWSVAFSPDGKRVVSGSYDHSIRVWDAESGEVVSGPFEGHTSSVLSVAFSPDRKRVVSGSEDHSIRVWDSESGEVVSGPFEGHTSSVWSVAFSPDGKRVVSGSHDHSIRVWDSESGEVVSGPFEGHTEGVLSVAFSPDGKRVVSGSHDHSIRVWDAESGEVVSGPFEGHTEGVWSVAFSPDGKRVVSGSEDHSIRVWDAESGEVVSGPFEGHTSSVWSVAFSPDGKRVVSGSYDHSIRVWDSESGEVVSGPFEGHMDSVLSVAFSPDGKRVVSGSSDHSIRVWDAESGEVVSGPFEGHTEGVSSVAFSPDGKRVVSGSEDHSIRVWDAKSGEVLSDPIEVLTENDISVAFSPDRMHSVSGSRDGVINVSNVDKGNVPSGSPEESISLNWVLSEDGWILGKQGELLLWIPPDIRPTLWRPRNTAVFSCRFSTILDFTDSISALGPDWQKGFNGHK